MRKEDWISVGYELPTVNRQILMYFEICFDSVAMGYLKEDGSWYDTESCNTVGRPNFWQYIVKP